MPTITLPAASLHLRDLDPANYVLSQELADAVQVALALEQPLLITGEPGTGKTRLADRVARDLHLADPSFRPKPLRFTTQTDSAAQDLFYHYDALSHFHDANLRERGDAPAPPVSKFIELRALGEAIARTHPAQSAPYLDPDSAPQNSVVLIDEIDKAPRDFPNNLLNQLDQYRFRIKEDRNREITLGAGQRVVVILTSNSEKTLPEAFLRRCVFFHIPFPDEDQLLAIVKARLGADFPLALPELVKHFVQLRQRIQRKPPATAELLAWLRVLELHRFLDGPLDLDRLTDRQKDVMKISFSVLAKTREDLSALGERS